MRHLKTQQQLNEATEKLNISGVISRLLSLQRIDIDTQDNGEFIEKDERIEEDGEYMILVLIYLIYNNIYYEVTK